VSWPGFPRTLPEFEARFGTERACRRFLADLRWPEGFQCPECDHPGFWVNRRGLYVCSRCQVQTSVTAGTMLHGTRKPLRLWFLAMWWVCTQKTGGSAKGLQRLLGLGSYQTAWTWLQKLRRAMVRIDREPLEGPVEIDNGFLGGKKRIGPNPYLFKTRVVVAVEIPGGARKTVGRVRFRVIPDFSTGTLTRFVEEIVAPGATVITDGWSGYALLRSRGFDHQARVVGHPSRSSQLLPHVNRMLALVKRWILGTHHGRIDPKHLPHYLEEFSFRFNRRKSRHVGWLFLRLLQQGTQTYPTTYKEITLHTQDLGGT